jgi:hypothetical protein
MMEKRGVVDENTPPEGAPAPEKRAVAPGETKEAADRQEDHFLTRLSDAAKEATSLDHVVPFRIIKPK